MAFAQFIDQHLLVKEDHGIGRLVLRGCAEPPIFGQMGEKGRHLGCCQFPGMSPVSVDPAERQKPPDPIDVAIDCPR